MTGFKIEILVNSPLETVYNAFVNPDNMTLWSRNLEKFEIVDGNSGEPGALARLHYNEKGKKTVMEDRLLETEPQKRILSEVSGEGFTAIVETEFESVGDQTLIMMNWRGTSTKFLVRIVLMIIKGRIRKSAMGELALFRDLVEKYGINFIKGTDQD